MIKTWEEIRAEANICKCILWEGKVYLVDEIDDLRHDQRCGALCGDWECSQPQSHKGPHIATSNRYRLCCIWDDEEDTL